ncbi:hypothetical protein QAD02_009826 [Eretmocerus hayati]|uniref:Uncharacterized protein n=1 Tax=Eretmocerus hayati TaxID=131215 RepID=A0ACC2NBP3_9HYME|nr:hypothetical protein QAD02_009826 [Eretmocerus hayati]
MPLQETEYCAQQLNVPPQLPCILKQFCKSAIRTQPYDLLKWSSAYFHALASGDEPPTKLRLEKPAPSRGLLTLGFLKLLLRQLGADYNKVVPLESIQELWDYLCLENSDSQLIVQIGKFSTKCQIKKFLSIGVGLLGRNLTETMISVCELFTHEPDGGSAMIPLTLFMEIYGYLADLRCDGCHRSVEDLCLCSDSKSSSQNTLIAEQQQQEQRQQQQEAASTKPPSIASQDTQADIDLELESFEHEAPSAPTLQSFGEETEESYRHEGEASYQSIDRTASSKSKISEDGEEEMIDEYEKSETETKEETLVIESKTSSSRKSHKETSSESTEVSNLCESTVYPDVPGIGRKLLAEEVAKVAVWMSECARRQGGMVGPRNIRHINCPPLEGYCCPRRMSCEDFLK